MGGLGVRSRYFCIHAAGVHSVAPLPRISFETVWTRRHLSRLFRLFRVGGLGVRSHYFSEVTISVRVVTVAGAVTGYSNSHSTSNSDTYPYSYPHPYVCEIGQPLPPTLAHTLSLFTLALALYFTYGRVK